MSDSLEFDSAHHVPRGSLVVLRTGAVPIPEDIGARVEEFSKVLAAEIGHDEFTAVVLGPGAEVEVLDEEAMGLLGWVRVPF